MPVTAYRKYFADWIAGRELRVFHSANIFPDDYTQVRAVTYSRTTDPVMSSDRLIPAGQPYRWQRLAFWIVTEWPFGALLQRHLADPVYFAGEPVTYRNYEASRDAAELEPASRRHATYLLQEYFVPVERFDEFVPHMRRVFQEHDVNVVNVSIRHATKDPGSILAWARTDVFAFVVYYKQETDAEADAAGERWTRELTDAALALGGSYYLPYRLHATPQQFRRAYPRADEFIALKQRLDPTRKFRNRFVDRYLP